MPTASAISLHRAMPASSLAAAATASCACGTCAAARRPSYSRTRRQRAGWTMGTRAQDCGGGAIACLAASDDGRHLYAATEEASCLGWDVRKLVTPLYNARVGRAVKGRASGIVALSHHPALRHTLVVRLSSGETLALTSHTAAVTALLPPGRRTAVAADDDAGPWARGRRTTRPLPRRRATGACVATAARGCGAARPLAARRVPCYGAAASRAPRSCNACGSAAASTTCGCARSCRLPRVW